MSPATLAAINFEGTVEDQGFVRFLNDAEEAFFYGRIDVSMGERTDSFIVASGRIVLESADDVLSRRNEQNRIIEIVRHSSGASGTYRCSPIHGVPGLELLPTISITDILRVVERQGSVGIAQSTASVPPAPPSSPVGEVHTAAAPAPPAPTPAPLNDAAAQANPGHASIRSDGSATERAEKTQARLAPERAFELRRMLRETKPSLQESATGEHVADVVSLVIEDAESSETGRSRALKGLIRRLAS